ncbi:MAG TPA: hypothetical protein VFS21_15075 [Roseiflexaceae bacterium]|nr:hypothetical protein [Roseiflexaceae bacterium]
MAESGVRALIEALAREEADLRGQEFLAPLTRGGRARLRLRGLIYELAACPPQPGWWRCRVLDACRAEVVEEALPWQRGDYLALWPALRVVLVAPLREPAFPNATWVALPFNPSDALQRFGLAGPLLVQLVDEGRPFDRAVARVEGATLWYDEPDRRGDPLLAEGLRAALSEERERPDLAGLAPGEAAAYALLVGRIQERRAADISASTEYCLRHALEVGGARLVDFAAIEEGLRVTWERDGLRSVTLVGADLGVLAAGICLSGEDDRFDLTSIVGVVRDAPDYAW